MKIKKFEKKTLNDNRPYLIHVWDKKTNESHQNWEDVKKLYNEMFELLSLDISEQENKEFAEKTFLIHKFPAIKYLPYEASKK